MPPRKASREAAPAPFHVQAWLDSAGATRQIVQFRRGERVFSQGGAADTVMYLQAGAVKLSVLSRTGKEAVVAMFGPGDFFGEGALADQPVRIATATATIASTVLVIEKDTMTRLLQQQPEFSGRFILYMLRRNARVEADLVDHLFHSSERRLARTLLLLANYGQEGETTHLLPRISQETLAEMIGTTRSRVNFFINKFRRQGFIEGRGRLTVHSSLTSVVSHD